ncbi:uncharacterized protein HD556DRAFT_1534484 [Suillus plorans]|uniref:Uncharacterized protein n=1 Tax=Suillus plorans TaxID=116603 RepID=A0A9P7DNG7_9AGAM|nr:uncharacterized protein HD556DRAFT_1534484 [Suillus plorans]KAG1799255.1 hypothetical protein HD556DRAFT_1534484 [Suillus plorans]
MVLDPDHEEALPHDQKRSRMPQHAQLDSKACFALRTDKRGMTVPVLQSKPHLKESRCYLKWNPRTSQSREDPRLSSSEPATRLGNPPRESSTYPNKVPLAREIPCVRIVHLKVELKISRRYDWISMSPASRWAWGVIARLEAIQLERIGLWSWQASTILDMPKMSTVTPSAAADSEVPHKWLVLLWHEPEQEGRKKIRNPADESVARSQSSRVVWLSRV